MKEIVDLGNKENTINIWYSQRINKGFLSELKFSNKSSFYSSLLSICWV